jgi:hypothetical protein
VPDCRCIQPFPAVLCTGSQPYNVITYIALVWQLVWHPKVRDPPGAAAVELGWHALHGPGRPLEMRISPFQYFDRQRTLARATAAGGEGNDLSHRTGALFCGATAVRARSPAKPVPYTVTVSSVGAPRATNTTSTVQNQKSCPKTPACTNTCNVSSC